MSAAEVKKRYLRRGFSQLEMDHAKRAMGGNYVMQRKIENAKRVKGKAGGT